MEDLPIYFPFLIREKWSVSGIFSNIWASITGIM